MALYLAGATDIEIAEKLGNCYATVKMWRYREKLPVNPARKEKGT